MTKMDNLLLYLSEHDYSDWTGSDWKKADAEWKGFPKESAEYKKYLLLKSQCERIASDGEHYRKYLRKEEEKRIFEEEKRSEEDDEFLTEEMLTWGYEGPVTDEGDYEEDFFSLVEILMEDHHVLSSEELCRKTEFILNADNVDVFREKNSPGTRDIIWAIAFALNLDEAETESLFNSYGMTLYGGYYNGKDEKERRIAVKRELVIRSFLECEILSIRELNKFLKSQGIRELGADTRK